MCGIYGLIGGSLEEVERSLLKRDRLSHRGPDDAGSWVTSDGRVFLGHRRLAVIDLSSAGHQPMASSDGRFIIIFNGEIYNFPELRRELSESGVQFKSHSDTEVVLAAFRKWGDACLTKLNGMFAFAIYDQGSCNSPASLFLARDRAGEKPLYYSLANHRFEFASELKALAHGKLLNAQAVNHFLALGYIPGSLSLLKGIFKLPAGHCARLNLKNFILDVRAYWHLPAQQAKTASLPELIHEASRIFKDSVRLRLTSDVPLGVLLSGGLDSSLVAAAAAECSEGPINTFTVKLPGSRLDESGYAKAIASHFGTNHHELELDHSSLGILDEISPFVDEPLADSSLLPTFMLSRLTRRHVTVALGGDGGDELFAGYNDYKIAVLDQSRIGLIPTTGLRIASDLASRLPAGVRGRNKIASLRGGPLQQIIWGSPYFDIGLRRQLLTPEFVSSLDEGLAEPEHQLLRYFKGGQGAVDCMTRTHFLSILPDDYLTKVDRASMAHGLELRCPFLDHRLIEFCFSQVPDQYKASTKSTRILERAMARKWLPANVDFDRKQGFSVPLDDWLRSEPPAQIESRMAGLPGFILQKEVRKLVQGLHRGRTNGARIFALMMLAISCRNLGL